METVVEEKPLSFATSRIVTVASFIASMSSLDRIAVNHRGLNSRSCWRTLQQRVKLVSSSNMRFLLIFLLFASLPLVRAMAKQQSPAQTSQSVSSPRTADPQQLFQQGE